MTTTQQPLPNDPHDDPPDGAQALLNGLAVGLDPVPLPPALPDSLGARLALRVARSAQASRPFRTVRRDDGTWFELSAGVRAKTLHDGLATCSLLLEFAPGGELHAAALPGHLRLAVHEWLVLAGSLILDGQRLGVLDYHLAGRDGSWGCVTSEQGARVYVRGSAEDEGGFGSVRSSHTVPAGVDGWEPLRAGVDIKPLFGAGPGISMLVRFRPGATVPGHPHTLDEECLMVHGELFLGDVLLREGEFQFAPGGSAHSELSADADCLLFFHGAIDPAAVDTELRASAGCR